jgi:HAMP domain-containing protein
MDSAREELEAQVRRVAEARQRLAEQQSILHDARQAFDAMHAPRITAIKGLAAEVNAAEDALEALTLAFYRQSGEKKPAAGVEVKEFEKLDYKAEEAFRWARDHGMAVTPESLDVKAFEKIAKATPLPFVTRLVEPRVQLSRTLGAVDAAQAAA